MIIYNLKKFYGKLQHSDNLFIAPFFNPFYISRYDINKVLKSIKCNKNDKILDIGCGNKPYLKYFSNSQIYHGLEITTNKNNKADFYYDGKSFPFENCSYTKILCTQVLEHVPDPNLFLKEIYRILSKNGELIITVPLIWDEHEVPYDFQRYTSYGIKKILSDNDFTILKFQKLSKGFVGLMQLIINFLYKKIYRNKILLIITNIAAFSVFTYIAIFFKFIFNKQDNEFYLDNFIIVKK